jgi:hypothetical protein
MAVTSRFRVISDAPSAVDSFSSHQPVADAIVALMDAERERGKAIGLNGSWGSGKSTIVELLRGRLSSEPHTQVFQFDAWQHQGDPLRRAFLDSLFRFLAETPGKWLNREKWSDDLDFVVGRKTKTVSTVEKSLTFWGALIAILLIICLPLGVAIANKYTTSGVDEGTTRKFFQTGVTLYLLPFAIAALVWLWQRPHARIWSRNFWTATRGSAENSFLRLLVKEPRETTITTSSKTLDPTSVEFRDAFVRMLDEALKHDEESKDPARRLVIVIENLDRVDPEDAVTIWSTMRIFFELDIRSRQPWESRLWLIVPFDRDALRRLWQADSAKDDKQSTRLVDSFVNKTFQIVFNVAPPVVRRRMDYFGELYDAGFPDEETRAYKPIVYGLYDRLGPDDAPPPREIKLFLNRLGALYLQSAAEIPLPLIALYQLMASKISPGARELMNDNFLEERTLSLLSKPEWRANWRTYLAAVHFNVPPTEALHVLNGERIAQTLEKGTREDVEARIAEQGFWSICDRVIWERHAEWRQQPMHLVHAIEMLREPLGTIDASRAEPVWTALASIADGVVEWPPLNQSTARAATSMLAYLKGRRQDTYASLATRLLSAATTPPSLSTRSAWYEGTKELFRYVDDDPDLHAHTRARLTNLPAADWLNLQTAMFAMHADPAFTVRFMYRSGEVDQIATSLFDVAIDRTRPQGLPFVAALKRNHANLPWASIAERVEGDFSKHVTEQAAHRIRILYVLRGSMASVGDAIRIGTDLLVAKANESELFKEWESVALCLLPVYERAMEGREQIANDGFINLASRPPLTSAFALALVDLDRLHILTLAPNRPDLDPFTQAVETAVVKIENVGARLSPPVMAAMAPRLKAALRPQLSSWSRRDDVFPFLTDPVNFKSENEWLFTEVLRTKDFARKPEIVAALIARLRELPTLSWSEGMERLPFPVMVRELVEIAGGAWIPAEAARTLLAMSAADAQGDDATADRPSGPAKGIFA